MLKDDSQEKLFNWMIENAQDRRLTVGNIVSTSEIYQESNGHDRCREDLDRLEEQGTVRCYVGSVSTWELVASHDRPRFMVMGIYKETFQRYVDVFDAASATSAENQAIRDAEKHGADLMIAGTVQIEAGTLDDMEVQ